MFKFLSSETCDDQDLVKKFRFKNEGYLLRPSYFKELKPEDYEFHVQMELEAIMKVKK